MSAGSREHGRESRSGAEHKPGIMIVEDERVVALHIERALTNLGYRVAGSVSTGEEALRAAESLLPELVLMDIRLPGETDGVQAARELRERHHIPVIFLTAFGDVETVSRAVDTDPLGYIVKPFREVDLRCVIEVALQRRRTEVALREREEALLGLSLVDELTSLKNRRGFFALAEQQLRVAHRYEQAISLFFMDLDGLKAINDELGHGAGDLALKDAAAVLRETFRDSDILARLGGDEFAVLAVGVGKASAERTRDRLTGNLQALNMVPERPFRLEMSLGVATYDPGGNETLDGFLARADAAMYREKRDKKRAQNSTSG